MSNFSIRNGLKLSWAHLHDEQMLLAWVLFMSPGIFAFEIGLFAPCAYWVAFNMIYVFIRCWDDPVALGWCGELHLPAAKQRGRCFLLHTPDYCQ